MQSCGQQATVTPVDVTLPRASATDLEPYEGMLVRLHQTVYVTEHFQLGRFGQVVVSSGDRLRQPTADIRATDQAAVQAAQQANDLNRLIIDDADQAQNPDPIVFGRGGQPLSASNTLRGGDSLTDAVGVLTYTWAGNAASGNAYRLRPVGALGGTAIVRAGRTPGRPRRLTSGPVGSRSPAPTCSTSSTPSPAAGSGRRARRPTAAVPTTTSSTSVSWPRRSRRCGSSAPTSSATWRWRTTGTARPAPCRRSSTPSTPPTARERGRSSIPMPPLGVVDVAGTDAIKAGVLYRTASVSPVAGATFVDQNDAVRAPTGRPDLPDPGRGPVHRDRQPLQVQGVVPDDRPGHRPRRRAELLERPPDGAGRRAGQLGEQHRDPGRRRSGRGDRRRPQLVRRRGPDRRAGGGRVHQPGQGVPRRRGVLLRVRRPVGLPRLRDGVELVAPAGDRRRPTCTTTPTSRRCSTTTPTSSRRGRSPRCTRPTGSARATTTPCSPDSPWATPPRSPGLLRRARSAPPTRTPSRWAAPPPVSAAVTSGVAAAGPGARRRPASSRARPTAGGTLHLHDPCQQRHRIVGRDVHGHASPRPPRRPSSPRRRTRPPSAARCSSRRPSPAHPRAARSSSRSTVRRWVVPLPWSTASPPARRRRRCRSGRTR